MLLFSLRKRFHSQRKRGEEGSIRIKLNPSIITSESGIESFSHVLQDPTRQASWNDIVMVTIQVRLFDFINIGKNNGGKREYILKQIYTPPRLPLFLSVTVQPQKRRQHLWNGRRRDCTCTAKLKAAALACMRANAPHILKSKTQARLGEEEETQHTTQTSQDSLPLPPTTQATTKDTG